MTACLPRDAYTLDVLLCVRSPNSPPDSSRGICSLPLRPGRASRRASVFNPDVYTETDSETERTGPLASNRLVKNVSQYPSLLPTTYVFFAKLDVETVQL